MTNFLNKITATVSGIALFAIGVVVAGLGFAAMGVLALFALTALGLGILAAPLVNIGPVDEADTDSRDAEPAV